MNVIEIRELEQGKYDVRFNGENIKFSIAKDIALCARVLSSCLKYVLSRL